MYIGLHVKYSQFLADSN